MRALIKDSAKTDGENGIKIFLKNLSEFWDLIINEESKPIKTSNSGNSIAVEFYLDRRSAIDYLILTCFEWYKSKDFFFCFIFI